MKLDSVHVYLESKSWSGGTTIFKMVSSSASEAVAASNQQSPSMPCLMSMRLAPPTNNFGLAQISCRQMDRQTDRHTDRQTETVKDTQVTICL